MSKPAEWVSVRSDAQSFGQHLSCLEPALAHFNRNNTTASGLESDQYLNNDSLIKWWETATLHFKQAANKADVANKLQKVVGENTPHLVMPLELQKMIKGTVNTSSMGLFGKAAENRLEVLNAPRLGVR